MSKGNLFLSQARGKVGSVVFSVLKGQQITRVYNPKPDNPRSPLQQAQRALLANATKYYKRAISNFYKFAYEDKERYESDYNAFAKENVMLGAYIPRDLYESPYYPALGVFQLSRGSIVSPFTAGWDARNFNVRANGVTGTFDTVGALSAALLSSSNSLATGDIITVVVGHSAATLFGVAGNFVPDWKVIQFVVDPDSQITITSLGLSKNTGYAFSYKIDRADVTAFGAVVVSRRTADGLKVSTSYAIPNSVSAVLTEWYRGSFARRAAAFSWGATDEAVLEGSFVSSIPAISDVSIDNNTRPAYSAQAFPALNSTTFTIGFTGLNLQPTASGGVWTVEWYRIAETPTGATPQMPLVSELTVTQTGLQYISSAIEQPNGKASDYLFLLKYNGEPISYGTIAPSAS